MVIEGFIDFVKPDIHVQNISPVINQGDNLAVVSNYDIDGETRIQSNIVDIGADECMLISRIYLPTILK